jgi:hypothetical protein
VATKTQLQYFASPSRAALCPGEIARYLMSAGKFQWRVCAAPSADEKQIKDMVASVISCMKTNGSSLNCVHTFDLSGIPISNVNPILDALEPLKSGVRSIILDFCDLETTPTSLTHFSLESLFIHEGNERLTPMFCECCEDGDITVIMK